MITVMAKVTVRPRPEDGPTATSEARVAGVAREERHNLPGAIYRPVDHPRVHLAGAIRR